MFYIFRNLRHIIRVLHLYWVVKHTYKFSASSVKTFESQNNKILNSLYMLNTLNNRAKYTFCLQPHNPDLDYYLTPHVQPLNVRRG